MKAAATLILAVLCHVSVAFPTSAGIPEVTRVATQIVQVQSDMNFPAWASGTWTAVSCTQSAIVDASIPADERWKAAGAQDAWTQLMAAWNTPANLKNSTLGFGGFAFNQFHDRDDTDCADIGSITCDTTTLCAKAGYPAAGFQLLNSIVGLHDLGQEAWNAIDAASKEVDSKMASFSGKFATFPADNSRVIKLIIDGIAGALNFGMAAFWNILIKDTALAASEAVKGTLQDSSYAVIGLVAASIKDGAIPPPADIYQEVALFEEFSGNYTIQLKNLFSLFVLRTLSAENATTQTQLTNLVHGGAILQIQQNATGLRFNELSFALSSILFGKLIQSAWAVSSNHQRPFILRVDKSDYKCGAKISSLEPNVYQKTVALGKFDLALWMTDDVAKRTSWCDSDGNSWFLLNAHYSQLQQQCETQQEGRAKCDGTQNPFQALDGGITTQLDGQTWGNVTIENIIRSSYGGFLANGHKNGYWFTIILCTGTDPGTAPLIGGITTPGFFNFAICLDARVAAKKIMNDPAQTEVPCDQYGGDSNPLNVGYKPGFCGVHIKQYQKNEPNEINPLPDYQMEITIKDGNGNQIGFATKQDAGHALIVDSRLPMGLIVQDGRVDDDPVCFWYSNQWWCSNDQEHHCNFGKYDTGKREGDCGFTCPLPSDTNDGPASQPEPTDAVFAESLDGNRPTNTTGSTSKPTPAPPPTYATGWCGVHVRQYQKNEGAGSDNPTGDYELEITLFDAKQKVVGSSGKVDAPTKKQVPVISDLPKTFYAVTQKVDQDVIQFSYDMQSWNSDHCAVGGYDSGHRDMDCGFYC